MTPDNSGRAWRDADGEDEMFASLIGSAPPGPSACPRPELVQASAMETLPADVQRFVDGHVQRCGLCQALLQAFDDPALTDLTAGEQRRIFAHVTTRMAAPARAAVRHRSWQWMYAAAAGVIATTAVVWQLRETRVPVDAPSPPLSVLLEKPAMEPPIGPGLVWRGAEAPDGASELTRALDAFRKDDFAEAASRFRSIVGREPQNAGAHFYLGVSELFRARHAEAVEALRHAMRLAGDRTELSGEAAWYLALAFRGSGQYDGAVATLDTLCRSTSSRAAQACAASRELLAASSTSKSR